MRGLFIIIVIVLAMVISVLALIFNQKKHIPTDKEPIIVTKQVEASDVVDATGDKIGIKGNYHGTRISEEALKKARRLSIQKELKKLNPNDASRKINFAKNILYEVSLAEIYQSYLCYRAYVYMPNLQDFRREFPQYSEEEAKTFLNYCQKKFEKFQNGDFNPADYKANNYQFPDTEYFKDQQKFNTYRTTLISEEDLILQEMRENR